MSDLVEQIDALLALNAKGAVSHPVPGMAVELLERAKVALSRRSLDTADGVEPVAFTTQRMLDAMREPDTICGSMWPKAAGDVTIPLYLASRTRNTETVVNEDDWSFQQRVGGWMRECFTPEIIADKLERNDRFIEEALELVQSLNYSAERAHALVDYVFGREKGEPSQEVGGVMVTLAALCNPNDLNMDMAAETELARILDPAIVLKIRAKQAAKPTGSALPIPLASPPSPAETDAARDLLAERKRQVEKEGWTPSHDDAHDRGELAAAAGCYALGACLPTHEVDGPGSYVIPSFWPWDGEWWKSSTRRRDLIKAGALILAEIERLDRAALQLGKKG
jgi:hypothetical protein